MQNPYVKTLEPVWQNLGHVFVNKEKLQKLIERMKKEELKTPAWTFPNVHPPIDCSLNEWVNFICWINTVNFAFTNFEPPYNKFTIEYPEGTIWNGAFALQASFLRACAEGIPVFDAKYMSRISLRDVKYIFRPVDVRHSIPMIRERWKIFHEVGRKLLKKSLHRGDEWFDLFSQGNFRAFNNGRGIVELLVANFPSFRDRRFYKGYHLEFNKRAQLLVMMYHGRAVNSGGRYPLIEDIEDIGPIADYDVPKALHFLGVLEYSPRLEAAIENHKVFAPNDPEEVESRLAMSYIMKKICDEVEINMAQADFYVWHLGRSSDAPHILVPTTDY
jgi:hypothetical protein